MWIEKNDIISLSELCFLYQLYTQYKVKVSPKCKIIAATITTLRKLKFISSLYLKNVTNFILQMKCCFIGQYQPDK